MAGSHRSKNAPTRRKRGTDAKSGGRGRGKRVLLWSAAVLAFVILAGAGGVYWIYQKLNANITSADIDDKLGEDRPEDLSPGAKTILIAGSDTREGMDEYGAVEGMRSDTLMILHIAENREWATVVSIPRDSWVEIPACDMGDGVMSEPHHAKINESYALGGINGDAGGAAACTIRTLEQNTGLRIENFVSLDFLGFKEMVDALGGVEMCLDEPIDDVKAHVTLDAGCQTLNGDDALGFVRVRYSVGDGSDIGRIERQQEFMNALAERAQSKLTSPTSLYGFMDAVTKSLTTDPELASLDALYNLATELQGVPKDKLNFITVPNYPRELDVPTDKANVVWDYPATELLFTSLAKDEPITKEQLEEAAEAAPSPSEVRVRVLNGTGTTGQAAEVADRLRNLGFQVVSTGNADPGTEVSTISYPEGLEGHADVLGSRVPGAQTQQTTDDLPGVLTLTIGADFQGVRG
ncbi:LCP family protein [Streptomyces carpaticus]|uniref:LCP family protein n=1 Tax=Streptomyces carpaticus TaxID=285558 RepID=A0ABV4ZKZ7_9ACTN